MATINFLIACVAHILFLLDSAALETTRISMVVLFKHIEHHQMEEILSWLSWSQ